MKKNYAGLAWPQLLTRTVMSTLKDQRTKKKDDDLYKLIKQIINVVPVIILKSHSLLDLLTLTVYFEIKYSFPHLLLI